MVSNMSKIDKTNLKVFDNSSPYSNNESINFNSFGSDKIFEALSQNSDATLGAWLKLQQSWCNEAFKKFKDYDTYLILIYLIGKVWKSYSDRFIFLSMEEFYSKKEVAIDKINLIGISLELEIPKETVRRKINFLQKKGVIIRKGKSIFINQTAFSIQKPTSALAWLANYLEKNSIVLSKNTWFGRPFEKIEIENFIKKYFTICWEHFFRLQIPFLVRHRALFGDLETWNVWGSIGISQYIDFTKILKNEVTDNTPKNYQDLLYRFLTHKIKIGINATSISEISQIPRATVIRKLKVLLKKKFIRKNEKMEYFLTNTLSNLKSFEKVYALNQKKQSLFVTIIFDLMKKSKFKI